MDWFNTVDLSYRQEFRELFDTNFSRFEAKLAQQTAELDAKLQRMRTDLIRWMFAFWIGSLVTTLGMIIAIRQLWR